MNDAGAPLPRLRTLYLLFALLALANGGCLVVAAGAAAGAGAAGYAYYKGKICQAYHASFDDTWLATRTALTELGMPIVGEERETTQSGFLKTQTADATPVRVYVDAVPSQIPAEGMLTRVCVRVATFGDPAVSERILRQVGAHLVPAGTVGTGKPVAVQPPANLPWVPVNQAQAPSGPRPPATPPPPLLPPEPVEPNKGPQ